jgi:O-antigen ligase/polysaccharide polymerase Wzy-like membrane protein
MEAIERVTLHRPRALAAVNPGAIAAWAFPVFVIVYLGVNNGGYGAVERSEVGIIVSWALLVTAAIGVLAVAGETLAGRIALGLLVAFAGWTALSLLWTGSSERTFLEVGRVIGYSALFALALGVQGRDRWRYMLYGVATGATVICAIGVLSRLEPTLFSVPPVTGVFGGIRSRLAYPLNYTSGMGGFAAITLPLLLGMTSFARTVIGQALAAAALPVVALALWLTASGLSLPVAVIAVVAFLLLTDDRLPKLITILAAGAGSALLFAGVVDRHALNDGLAGPLAQRQGDEVLTVLLVACAGVGLVQAAVSVTVRRGRRPSWLVVSRPQARAGFVGLLVVAAIGLTAFVASGEASDAWNRFKGNADVSKTSSRGTQLLDYSSSGRYAYWREAVDASKVHPWRGIGAGTYEFWWAKHGNSAFVRNAHSLYLESLAELGIVGFLLIAGLSVLVLVVGAVRALGARGPLRVALATATAGCAGFVAAAAVDWMWQLAVVAAVFLLLAAIVVAAGGDPASTGRRTPRRPLAIAGRVAMIALAVVALVVNGILLASNQDLEQSQAAARSGNLRAALDDAQAAASVQPYTATPHLQEALVLEEMGRLGAARSQAEEATRNERPNWRNWLVLSRLEARTGHATAAVRDFRRAHSLNPHFGLLNIRR